MNRIESSPKFAPAKYKEHFTLEEFKFRWVDALVEVRDEWVNRSVDHVARVLVGYMDQEGFGYPGIPAMARAMRVSKSTTRRAIELLVENGWLLKATRNARTNEYQAVLPEYGLNLLVERREERSRSNSVGEWQTATQAVLDRSCAMLSISPGEWAGTSDWARLEGRVRQVLRRLGGPNADLDYMVKLITQEPPVSGVRNPVGFLLERLSRISRIMPNIGNTKIDELDDHLNHSVQNPDFVKEIVRQTSLTMTSRTSGYESRDQPVVGPSS
jgi:hypothetical protein